MPAGLSVPCAAAIGQITSYLARRVGDKAAEGLAAEVCRAGRLLTVAQHLREEGVGEPGLVLIQGPAALGDQDAVGPRS